MCDWTRLYCCNNTAARLSRAVGCGLRTRYVGHSVPGTTGRQGVMRAGCGGRDIFTAIVPRSTNRCKQSVDRFELANGRCLNEFRYSFSVYTENETENENATSFSAENATSFSAVNESDRNQHKLAFSAPKTKTKFGRTLAVLVQRVAVWPVRMLRIRMTGIKGATGKYRFTWKRSLNGVCIFVHLQQHHQF